MLKYAHEQGCLWDKHVHGRSQGRPPRVPQVCARAGLPVGLDTCTFAADKGQLEIIKWAHEHGCPSWDVNVDMCAHAAKGGHLECLQWARAQGAPWDASTFARGLGRPPRVPQVCTRAGLPVGHQNVQDCGCWRPPRVPQVRARNQCRWNRETCSNAAGVPQCLKFAHENNCRWDEWTCAYAALGGHFECLKYAHKQGCKWDAKTCATRPMAVTSKSSSGRVGTAAPGTRTPAIWPGRKPTSSASSGRAITAAPALELCAYPVFKVFCGSSVECCIV